MADTTPQTAAAAPTPPADEIPRGKLRLKNVRQVFRLINDIRELGNDPQRWRPHMVAGLRKILGASIVVSSEVHFRQNSKTGSMRVYDIGWVCDPDGNVSDVRTERDDERPEAFWLTADPEEATAPAAAAAAPAPKDEAKAEKAEKPAAEKKKPAKKGTALADDPDWYERLAREEEEEKRKASAPAARPAAAAADEEPEEKIVPVRPAKKIYGGRSFIMSQVSLPHAGAVDQLGVHREFGDEPFTKAHHRLLRLLHTELARLWQRDVLRQAKDSTSDLPPRLQQTLEELLVGSSEKQIATKLELSRHTIHNYVKALHQRFGVSSRGELLAKAGQAKAGGGPKLSLTLPKKPMQRRDEAAQAKD
ncbi:MAG TPA: LuxR C-terminal-related transcriptional regulator [Humisphaera sp.]